MLNVCWRFLMAGITKFTATLSRITLAAMMFTAMSTASLSTANAAPLNGMGEEDYVLLFGPNAYRSPLVGKRTTTEQLSIAPAPQAAQLFIVNGTGDDLRPTNCSPLPLVQRLLCLASNIAKAVRVELERPQQIEIALNGQVLVTQQNLPQLTNTLLVPITLQASNSLKITLKGSPLSFITVSVRGIDHTPPEILLVSPQEGQIFQGLALDVEGQSNERLSSVTARLQGEALVPMTLSSDGRNFEGEITSSSPGPKTLIVVARDLAGNETVLQRQVRLDFNRPPEARLTLASSGTGIAPLVVLFDASQSSDPDGDSLQYRFDFDDGTVRMGADAKTSHEFSSPGNYDVEVRVTDPSGRTSTAVVAVQVTSPILPPDPVEIAPPLAQDAPQPFHETIEFLYSGSNPIQKDVQLSAIREDLVATLSGQVLDQDGTPLAGVKVTSLGKSELGYTISREDGKFDIAFNSGGFTTLKFERNGYATASRDIETRLQTMYGIEPVRLVKRDSKVTTLQIGSDIAQVASGTPTTDERGTRTATVLIPPNTTAHLRMPGGGTIPVENLNVRMTEFTVGPDGPKRMPAALPPQVAYTYALEITADEAIALGAEEVVFSQPVPFYVDNFLSLPAGIAMPLGYLNPKTGYWEADQDGIVVHVLAHDSGKAVLDLGDGQAASPSSLAHHAILDSELEKIVGLYEPGQSFWRLRLKHFSTYDANGNGGAQRSDQAGDANTNSNNQAIDCPGCVIDIVSGNIREQIDLPGTGTSLHYSSMRGGSRDENATIRIRAFGDQIPESIVFAELYWMAGGRSYTQPIPKNPNEIVEIKWDGRDLYGRQLYTEQNVIISLSYYQSAPYWFQPYDPDKPSTWADLKPGEIWLGSYQHHDISTVGRNVKIRPPQDLATRWATRSIGKWTFGMHHFFDISSESVFKGDGTASFFNGRPKIVRHLAGGNGPGFSGDGGLAINAQFNGARNLKFDNEGNILVADILNHRIRKIDKVTGIITTIAGNGSATHSGDGGLAINAGMITPVDLAVDRDGNIFFSDYDAHRVRKIDRNGIITTVVGTGTPGYSGDGGPATQAQINGPRSVITNPDGSLYISEEWNHVIRRVDASGSIRTYAGTGQPGNSGDGGPASEAQFSFPNYTARDRMGNLYIAQSGTFCSIRKISAGRIVSTVAGTGVCGDGQDGEPATITQIGSVAAVAVSPSGKLYIADRTYHKIRSLDSIGNLETVIGTGQPNFNGLGRSGATSNIVQPTDVEVRPDGSLVFIEYNRHAIREFVQAPSATFSEDGTLRIASEDSSEIWVFDSTGRHLRTLFAETNKPKYSFGYAGDRLTSISDSYSNTVNISRDGSGEPQTITSPYGAVFDLNVDGEGHTAKLIALQYPTGELFRASYNEYGMITRFFQYPTASHNFEYDAFGRLIGESNPVGGSQTFTRNSRRSAEGQVIRFAYNQSPTGASYLEKYIGDETYRTYNLDSGLTATFDATRVQTNTLTTSDTRFYGLSSFQTHREEFVAQEPWRIRHRFYKTYSPIDTDNFIRTDRRETDYGFIETIFNSATKTYATTTSEGRVTTVAIDDQTKPTRVQVGTLAQMEFQYDSRGRLSQLTQGSRTTKFRYDAYGFLSETENALGEVTSFVKDTTGKVVKTTNSNTETFEYSYDAYRNLSEIVLPGNILHRLASNAMNDLRGYVGPLGRELTFEYTRDRELSLVTRADGKQIQYHYHPNEKRQLAGIQTPTQSIYVYSMPNSPLIAGLQTTDNIGIVYEYSGSRVSKKHYSFGPYNNTQVYSYDQNGRLPNEVQIQGASITFDHNTDHELIRAGSLNIGRDQQSGLITGKAIDSVVETLSYNVYGETESRFANGGIGGESYSRDALGRITERFSGIGGIVETSQYTYDPVGRLVRVVRNGPHASDVRYSYDSRGNRLSVNRDGTVTTSTYDNEDRLLTGGDWRYAYTDNGELLEKENIVTGEKLTLTYDERGQLTRAILPNSGSIQYLIDGEGKRVMRSLNGVTTHAFLYDLQGRLVAELDPSGVMRSRFIYATQTHSPDYMIRDGANYYFAKDQLGSIRAVVDSNSGTITQLIQYDEFGRVLSDSNPGFQPFGFAGGHYDHQTGLVRFGARDYDAEIGRWVSKDPILFDGGDANIYRYVLNDPVNLIDPSGLTAKGVLVGGIVGGLIGFKLGGPPGAMCGAAAGMVIGDYISNRSGGPSSDGGYSKPVESPDLRAPVTPLPDDTKWWRDGRPGN